MYFARRLGDGAEVLHGRMGLGPVRVHRDSAFGGLARAEVRFFKARVAITEDCMLIRLTTTIETIGEKEHEKEQEAQRHTEG